MSELPGGWAGTTLGQIGEYMNGRGFKKSEWRESGRPIIRIQNLTGSGDGFNYFNGEPEESYTVRSGDLLVSWAATLGVYVWKGPEAVVNQHIFKVRSHIDHSFHRYLLLSVLDALRRQTHGSGMVHITKRRFAETPVALPSLAEQRRIVAAIEQQFSRLDAAEDSLHSALRRTSALRKMVLGSVIPKPVPEHWRLSTVGESGAVDLGRQRSPKYHRGPNMRPYLRVANVFENRLDFSDVMEMDFPPDHYERCKLEPGDILLNEGQSPEFVGRPAMYRGELPGVCFTNSLIRFRPGADVDGEFALIVFRSHLHTGRFQREARITTNIAHMAAGRFKKVEFPVPPLNEQRRIVAEVERQLSLVDALSAAIDAALRRSGALRRSILERAFTGKLVPQDPSDEPASVLLERIRAEQAEAAPTRQRRVRSSR